MLKRILLYFLFLHQHFVFTQVPNTNVFDFGEIEVFNNDTANFIISNNTSKTVYLLPTAPKEDYKILVPSTSLNANNTMQIRIVYYTASKGKFNLQVPLYFSNLAEPVVLHIKGNIKAINRNAFNTCPSIENSKKLSNNVPLTVIVMDYNTNEKLTNTEVYVIKKNRKIIAEPFAFYQTIHTDYGKLLIHAKKEGYLEEQAEINYTLDNHICTLFLKRPTEQIKKKIEKKDTVIRENVKLDTLITTTTHSNKSDSFFNTTLYKRNHLIFIIDVSGSMLDSTKLPYLKLVMKELLNNLRPQDNVSVITYSTRHNIILENKSGNNKNSIYQCIDSLHAKGGSYGAEAIEYAYILAQKYFIEDGNNQIFIATDGIFNGKNFDKEKLYKRVKKEWKNNHIKLSTIAFGSYTVALDFLQQLANNGNGKMLRIHNLKEDKEILVQEVKLQSRINP